MRNAVGMAILFCAALAAQGTAPRSSAADYPVRGSVGNLTIGAEYLVHSIPAAEGMLYSPAYLVVEVAVFGPKLAHADLSASYFSLRLNGAKQAILAQQPFMVANSMEGPPSCCGPKSASWTPPSNTWIEPSPAAIRAWCIWPSRHNGIACAAMPASAGGWSKWGSRGRTQK